MKFRKKPVVIDAWRWPELGSTPEEFSAFRSMMAEELGPLWGGVGTVFSSGGFWVQTLEGRMEGLPGDWLIKGVEGELYPCAHKIFMKTYEEAA